MLKDCKSVVGTQWDRYTTLVKMWIALNKKFRSFIIRSGFLISCLWINNLKKKFILKLRFFENPRAKFPSQDTTYIPGQLINIGSICGTDEKRLPSTISAKRSLYDPDIMICFPIDQYAYLMFYRR